MMPEARLLFSVAIGQAPEAAPLPGTYTVAKSMVEWGRAAGFSSVLITDEQKNQPVTVARLHEVITPELRNPERAIDHLIFHFAGHGFTRDGQQILLLSDWSLNGDEAIHLPQFQKRLDLYRLKRVTLIIDACQIYESDATAYVNGSGILDTKVYDRKTPRFDYFYAAIEGRPAYMLRGNEHEPPVCLFSALMLHAMAGAEAPAIRTGPAAIRSWDICEYIEGHMREAAAKYQIRQQAACFPGFPPDSIYAVLPLAPYKPPTLPEPKAAQAMAAADLAAEAQLVPLVTALPTISVIDTLGLPGERPASRVRERMAALVLDSINAAGKGLNVLNQARLRYSLRKQLRKPKSVPKSPTAVAAALRQLASNPETRRIPLADGILIVSTPATPAPELLTRDGVAVGLRLSTGVVAPLQVLPGLITVAYVDGALPGGGLLALDWQPPDASPQEGDAMLGLLADLADNQLLPRGLARDVTGVLEPESSTELVHRQPMAALVRAYLADGAGDRQGVRALSDRFYETYGLVPFDLAVLTSQSEPSALLGTCPLFVAGWRLLNDADFPVQEDLSALTRQLVQGYPFAMFADAAATEFVSLISMQED